MGIKLCTAPYSLQGSNNDSYDELHMLRWASTIIALLQALFCFLSLSHDRRQERNKFVKETSIVALILPYFSKFSDVYWKHLFRCVVQGHAKGWQQVQINPTQDMSVILPTESRRSQAPAEYTGVHNNNSSSRQR